MERQRLATSWAPSRRQKGNSFLSCLASYIWLALSNLTLSVRKSISYFDQILLLGTKYWPADIDDINIDEDVRNQRTILKLFTDHFQSFCADAILLS